MDMASALYRAVDHMSTVKVASTGAAGATVTAASAMLDPAFMTARRWQASSGVLKQSARSARRPGASSTIPRQAPRSAMRLHLPRQKLDAALAPLSFD
jgi:hypothetical protein